MNFSKLTAAIAAIVMGFALTGQLPKLQLWIWKAQAKIVYESRTSSWGSPRFFPNQKFISESNKEKKKAKDYEAKANSLANRK